MITEAEIFSCQVRRRNLLDEAARDRLGAAAAQPGTAGRLSGLAWWIGRGLRHPITSLARVPERRPSQCLSEA